MRKGDVGWEKVTDFEFKPNEGLANQRTSFSSFHKFPNVNKELGPEMKINRRRQSTSIDDLMDDDSWKFMRSETLFE